MYIYKYRLNYILSECLIILKIYDKFVYGESITLRELNSLKSTLKSFYTTFEYQ